MHNVSLQFHTHTRTSEAGSPGKGSTVELYYLANHNLVLTCNPSSLVSLPAVGLEKWSKGIGDIKNTKVICFDRFLCLFTP